MEAALPSDSHLGGDRDAARVAAAAELLRAAHDAFMPLASELQSFIDVVGCRAFSAEEFSRYLELRRDEDRALRLFLAARRRYESARRRRWQGPERDLEGEA